MKEYLYFEGKEECKLNLSVDKKEIVENKQFSCGEDSENMLIQGDNLEALVALLPMYKGRVKCIYIDPPYNTKSAFEHYDDNLEHTVWLKMMYPRLEVLRELLAEDGSIWVSIDADESHYLKVIMDEIFGRKNFVDEVVWQRSYAPINLKKTLSRSHDSVMVYSRNSNLVSLNKMLRDISCDQRYKNIDNDTRGSWTSGPIQVGPRIESKVYEIITPSGRKVLPPLQYCWRFTRERFQEMVEDNRIWFGKDGDNVPRIKRFLSEVKQGITPMTLWLRDDCDDNQKAKREIKELDLGSVFATPKPEKLIQRILHIASNEGDLVLDSFLGSGTTAAVAHKMGRRYIGIEMGDHAKTHCAKRLQKVIDGEQGGISKSMNWKGGGGFKFYEIK